MMVSVEVETRLMDNEQRLDLNVGYGNPDYRFSDTSNSGLSLMRVIIQFTTATTFRFFDIISCTKGTTL